MLFSVIIPTANRNELLAKCLDCLKQSIQLFNEDEVEVIVTDDGKNNEAKEFIAKNYTWVKWIEGPKKGPAANRNNGAKNANGEWLIFLDDDCEPSVQLLKAYYDAVSQNKNVFVFEGRISTTRTFLNSLESAPINENGGLLWSCNFCVSKTIFNLLNGFDEVFKYPHLEDNDFKLRIDKLKHEIEFVPEALVLHPPRKLASGKKLGLYHQYDIYFYQKHLIKYSFFSIIKNIIINRSYSIVTRKFTRYTFISIYYMFCEIIVVTINFSKWKHSFTGMSLSKI
ncbi:MAG: glycosyltransferase [Bacteroidetes bacterium]|nr:glycosyltransferase [Bacteroidota bacterium]MBS1591531.1 glycosyltransferase [Bacteroidota bacterium]MBS1670867.1 glycosyltransferase [Bacteroidota bacterium]